MTGRLLSEPLGKLHFWLMFVGMNLAFFPMHFIGLLGMPRRIYTYSPDLGVAKLNLLSTIGALIIGVSALVFVFNIWRTRRHGAVAGNDPWQGATLEWATTSPPPGYNFTVIPTVESRPPLCAGRHPPPTAPPPSTPPQPRPAPPAPPTPLLTPSRP